MHRAPPIGRIAAAAALIVLSADAGAQYAISQVPVLTSKPLTNIVLTIDDSGSMQWAYVPDGMSSNIGTRRFNAGTFNALAYNPKIYYPPPVKIDNTGKTVALYTCFSPSVACASAPTGTTATGAFADGFNTAAGWVDLATSYQPTASYTPGSSSTNQNFSRPVSQDLPTICAPASTCSGAAAYYYVYDITQTNCTSSVTDDNCYRYVKVTATSGQYTDPVTGQIVADERQNFANWYSFYRIRHLMIASAAALTMADSALTQARVTWRDFWTCTDFTAGNTCAGWDGSVVDNKLRTFDDTVQPSGLSQRAAFYNWLSRVPANQSTPTRGTWKYIGDYFSNTTLGVNGPYGINPNEATTVPNSGEVACVQNYNITLTDGQWNGESDNFFGAADDKGTSLPANAPVPANPVQYTPSGSAPMAIYSNDSNHDVLADIAFHYWSNNLRPDLANSVTAVTPYYAVTTGPATAPITTADYWNPQNDPATWPHLVQITIGIGMTSTMTVPGLPWWGNDPTMQYILNSTTNAGYSNLWNGSMAWPVINNGASQGDMGKAYDLWHAAINSRGLAFSAESPADLIGALQSSLNRIKAPMSAQSAVATNSTSLNNGTVLFVGSYTSSDWHGTVKAIGFTNSTLNTTPVWTTDTAGTFGSPGTRVIVTSDTASVTSPAIPSVRKGIDFSLSSAAFTNIWNAVNGITTSSTASAATASSNMLSWLRGDATQELRNPPGVYRNRPISVLGDIVDSGPTFTFQENFGYAALQEGMNASPTYLSFLSTKKNNGAGTIYSNQGMVYVGANDGMLHGFDAGSGKEVFAYVPRDVVRQLPALTDPSYSHQFYVDQTPYVGDACVGTGPTSCTWSTVLVGTLGAGGQGVFALDVTSPASMESASGAAGKVLWDLDGQGAGDPNGDPDLGYTIGRPIIARLNDGNWAAIFGNGYLSSNGCAVLFIVRLNDGVVTRIGTTGSATTTVCTATNINQSNGLGPVTLADVDGNLTTDYVYAGDLQGNLWKFDLTAASSGSWKVAFSGAPLFAATTSSCWATSTSPNTCQPITSAPLLGPALPGMTGTMVYFGTGRLFATGDLATTASQALYGILDNGQSPVSGGPGALVAETLTPSGSTRTVSTTPVPGTSQGWYINLPAGERVTFSPILLNGFVVFGSDVPSSSTCTAGGSGWIMAFSATSNVLGGPNENFFLGNPKGISAVAFGGGLPEGMIVLSSASSSTTSVGTTGGKTTTNSQIVTAGTNGQQINATQGQSIKGRISWHELVR
jgi:type IV pilus assembly protein PilY1